MKRRDVIKGLTLIPFVGGAVSQIQPVIAAPVEYSSAPDLSKINPGSYDGSWWNRSPIRMIQTNMNEKDAMQDTDQYVKMVVDTGANMTLINVGGIVANYDTKLPFHYKNTFMKGDYVADLLKKLHAKNIRVIGRFDFSKVNESIAAQKPEWLYIGNNGTLNQNGQVSACLNGGYQQSYTFDILKEVVANYPLDGIFFNMPGYNTSDYAGNNYGICQCENCKKRFLADTGLVLPKTNSDPTAREYRLFQDRTRDELFQRIHDHIKTINPKSIIICYQDAGVDLIRIESASFLNDTPEWNYNATDHVKGVLGSYKDRMPSNLLQYFFALTYRHIGTSPNISRIWVLENMLNAAPLDVYIAGTLLDQEDRTFFPSWTDIFNFHKKNEKLFANMQAVSNVALIKGAAQEFRGMIKLLTENHIMYDIIEPSVIGGDRMPRKLQEYEAVILGDVTSMSDELIAQIDTYVNNGGKLLATGFSGRNDGVNRPVNTLRLKSLGVQPEYQNFPRTASTYLKLVGNDKSALGQDLFKDMEILMMYTDFQKVKTTGNAKMYTRLLPGTKFGPPEKIYYDEFEITEFPGVVSNDYGKGKSVFIPWQVGSQYNFKGHHGHRALFLAAMNNLLKVSRVVETDASPLIEITYNANRNKAFEWFGLINHSGQLGASIREPVTISNIAIKFKPAKPLKELHLLRSETAVTFKQNNGWVEFVVPKIDDFEMILCLYK